MSLIQLAMASTVLFLGSSTLVHGQSLRYAWTTGQKFSYEVDINVENDDRISMYRGVINYTVDAAKDQSLRLTYQGGLTETSKPKGTTRSSVSPFGPLGIGGVLRGPQIPGIFGRGSTVGWGNTTNRIIMNPMGGVLSLEGSSQMPYLLGNLSLIPFEALPKDKEQKWKSDAGISITEENRGKGFPFGPLGALVDSKVESRQAASESTHYKILESGDKQVVIEKKYQLKSPPIDDKDSFSMTGTGTWTFDLKENVPHSGDMKFELIVRSGNTTTTIPISAKFVRLTDERIAEMAADAKKKLDEQRTMVAEMKAKAEAAFTPSERQEILKSLASSESHEVNRVLMQLESKTPKEEDIEIRIAIKKHLGSDNSFAAQVADRALEKWDPIHKLVKAYEGSRHVESSKREVNSLTPLYEGQIVQVQEHGSWWYAAEVVELLGDGKVKIRYRGWGGNRNATVSRRNIQLAPEGVPQPKRPAESTTMHKPRSWSDATGTFKIEAVFLGMDADQVKLRRMDGIEISVPIDRLNRDDQEYVKKTIASPPKLENPFEPK